MIDKKLLVKAIKEGLEKARAVNVEDNGTCNFDTCILIEKNGRLDKITEIVKQADNNLHVSKWRSGEFHIYGYERGQANLRTEMVETFTKVLEKYGFNVGVYYAMD